MVRVLPTVCACAPRAPVRDARPFAEAATDYAEAGGEDAFTGA